jgi:acyl carrier protein
MRLEELFAELLQEPVDRMSDETSPKTVKQWDSLKHLDLVMALEEKFGVTFSAAELTALSSLGAARRLLAQKGATV